MNLIQVADDIKLATQRQVPDLRAEYGRIWFTANGDLQIRCKSRTEALIVEQALRQQAPKLEPFRKALEFARDALRNDFEPNNQSTTYHKVCDLLKELS